MVAVTFAMVPSTGATTSACDSPIAYPVDDASQDAIAQWMAHGARARGIPAELPVMAALVESGLKNLTGGDLDAVGYFQMRVSIWDSGAYAGFPDHPELQLTWFIDHAIAARDQRVAAGDLTFGADPREWGDWVADVEQPAEQYRYRYQLKLGEASLLVGAECSSLPAPAAGDDAFSALQEWTLTVPAPGVLANDSGVAGANLSAELVSGPAHGSLQLAADGSLSYVGNEDFTGTDTFAYRVHAGAQVSGAATVTVSVRAACDGRPATVVGTAAGDRLVGTPGSDVIAGLGGNDTLVGAGGDDRLCGGSGRDELSGGVGNDRLGGGSGTDFCIGGPGVDAAAACEITSSVP